MAGSPSSSWKAQSQELDLRADSVDAIGRTSLTHSLHDRPLGCLKAIFEQVARYDLGLCTAPHSDTVRK